MSDVTTVPRSDGKCHLAFLVLARKGEWAIGQTAHAGIMFDDGEIYSPAPQSEPRLTWMREDLFYGQAMPLWRCCTLEEITEAMDAVQGLEPPFLIAASRYQDKRKGRKWSRPFRLEHLREMIAAYRSNTERNARGGQ